MTNKPLKNKEKRVYSDMNLPIVFSKEDIKSAVEWLIRIMKKEGEPSNVLNSNRKNVDLEIAIINVKKAFEDVIKR